MRTLILYCLLLSCDNLTAQFSPSTWVSIPDTSFEAKLIELGIDSDQQVNGKILRQDAHQVKDLDLNGFYANQGEIRDLTGVEAFVNLTRLDCAAQKLTHLNITQNKLLQSLYCDDNQIKKIDLSQNKLLERLHCSHNLLEELDISNNQLLTQLHCSENSLKTLDLKNTPKLYNISCDANQLASLALEYLLGLKVLNCSYNAIRTLTFSKKTKLYYLNCRNNKIEQFKHINLQDIETIHCQNNQLSELDLAKSPKLGQLYCYNNKLTSLDCSQSTSLRFLECYNNMLMTLSLPHSNRLAEILCQNNNLKILDLVNLTTLEYLDATNNDSFFKVCVHSSTTAARNKNWKISPSAIYTEECASIKKYQREFDAKYPNLKPDEIELITKEVDIDKVIVAVVRGDTLPLFQTQNCPNLIAYFDFDKDSYKDALFIGQQACGKCNDMELFFYSYKGKGYFQRTPYFAINPSLLDIAIKDTATWPIITVLSSDETCEANSSSEKSTSYRLDNGNVITLHSEIEKTKPSIDEIYFEHTVSTSGESLWTISQKYKVSFSTVKVLNPTKGDIIIEGDVIKVPKLSTTKFHYHLVNKKDTLWSLSQQYRCSVDSIKTANNIIDDIIQIDSILIIPR